MLELGIRVVVSLGLVLGLFWLVARSGSRRFAGGARSVVRVRGRQSLSRTSSLAVVEVGSRVLVVGVSDGGVNLLTELDPAELEALDAGPNETRETRETRARGAHAAARPSGPTAVAVTSPGLNGSLLATGTWKQAWAAATGKANAADQPVATVERDIA